MASAYCLLALHTQQTLAFPQFWELQRLQLQSSCFNTHGAMSHEMIAVDSTRMLRWLDILVTSKLWHLDDSLNEEIAEETKYTDSGKQGKQLSMQNGPTKINQRHVGDQNAA